jgi:hypothetical protein
MHLASSHRRSLSVTARIVEDSPDEIEKVLTKKERQKSSHRVIDSLDEATRQKILGTVAKLRESNDEMFRSLHLEPNVFSETQIGQIEDCSPMGRAERQQIEESAAFWRIARGYGSGCR